MQVGHAKVLGIGQYVSHRASIRRYLRSAWHARMRRGEHARRVRTCMHTLPMRREAPSTRQNSVRPPGRTHPTAACMWPCTSARDLMLYEMLPSGWTSGLYKRAGAAPGRVMAACRFGWRHSQPLGGVTRWSATVMPKPPKSARRFFSGLSQTPLSDEAPLRQHSQSWPQEAHGPPLPVAVHDGAHGSASFGPTAGTPAKCSGFVTFSTVMLSLSFKDASAAQLTRTRGVALRNRADDAGDAWGGDVDAGDATAGSGCIN